MKKIYKLVVIALIVCFSTSLKAQSTPGTMTFHITCPKNTTGAYAGGIYTLAVWIESCTACTTSASTTSTFVKTNVRYWGGGTNDHLPTWVSKSGSNTTGATTGATSSNYAAQTITWNGTNAAGTVVADGSYRVVVQKTWGHGTATQTRYFPFTKGTATFTNTTDCTADTNFTGLSLTWAPTLATATFSKAPEAIVYPNPSKGIFNIDFKSDATNIQVVDLIGKVVYNEDIKQATSSTTKSIDLSDYNDGVYLINVSDDNGTSTYKVVLQK